MNTQQKDEMLWKTAKKRAAFKWSFTVYIFVNIFLIGIWYFTKTNGLYFWPMWPVFGWGTGIAFQYFDAYHNSRIFSAEDEYEKLRMQKD